jgi:hypothetical protein
MSVIGGPPTASEAWGDAGPDPDSMYISIDDGVDRGNYFELGSVRGEPNIASEPIPPAIIAPPAPPAPPTGWFSILFACFNFLRGKCGSRKSVDLPPMPAPPKPPPPVWKGFCCLI